MAERPVFHKELGKFFTGLRTSKKWGQRQAETIAISRGLAPPLTRQVLLRLEAGRTKNPEPDVLRAVAALYKLDYQVVVAEFLRARYGLELTRHGIASDDNRQGRKSSDTQDTAISTGTADAQLSAAAGFDLPFHGGNVQTDSQQQGESRDPAQTRLRELEARVERLEIYEKVVKRLRPMLGKAIALIGDEDAKAAGAEAPRRRRN